MPDQLKLPSITHLPRCWACGRLMHPTEKRFIKHLNYGRLYDCKCGMNLYFDDEEIENERLGSETGHAETTE